MEVADWVTISALATAGGTLVLASATFASVRSANRAALWPRSRFWPPPGPCSCLPGQGDLPIRVGFWDDHFVLTPGGGGTAEVAGNAIYLTMSLRNVGNGIVVLHGWRVERSIEVAQAGHPALDGFRRLTRDLCIAAGDIAFWQGAFRDPAEPEFDNVSGRIAASERIAVDPLYGDHQGSQRVISRFMLRPQEDGKWLASVGRHWNFDRPDPR